MQLCVIELAFDKINGEYTLVFNISDTILFFSTSRLNLKIATISY